MYVNCQRCGRSFDYDGSYNICPECARQYSHTNDAKEDETNRVQCDYSIYLTKFKYENKKKFDKAFSRRYYQNRKQLYKNFFNEEIEVELEEHREKRNNPVIKKIKKIAVGYTIIGFFSVILSVLPLLF